MSSGRSHLIQYLFSLSNNCSCSFALQCFVQAKRRVYKRKKNTYMSLSSFPTFWQALQVPPFMLHSKCVCVCIYIYEHYIKYILYIHTEDPSSHQYYTFWRTQQFRIKNRSRMKGGKKKKLPKIPRKASHSLQVPGDPIFLWSKE